MMKVGEARQLAQGWVEEEAAQMPGFMGAFFAGSTNTMDPNAPMPFTSDVDVFILVDGEERSLTKFTHGGFVVDASIFPAERFFQPAEKILSDFRYACHFAHSNVIADPTGRLTQLQKEVAAEYAHRIWVQKRCEMLHDRLVNEFLADEGLARYLYPGPTLSGSAGRLHYALMLAAQIPAIANLRCPTIRRSLVVCGDVLKAVGRSDILEALLDCMGVLDASHSQASAHLQAFAHAYDRAADIISTSFFFSSAVSHESRHIAIDGAHSLIDTNLHREAMWWIHLVYDWVQQALQNDAPDEEKGDHAEEYKRLLSEINQGTLDACEQRLDRLRSLVPELMSVAAVIMDHTPSISATGTLELV